MDLAAARPAAALVSTDQKSGLIVTGIVGAEAEQQSYTKELTDAVVGDRDGVTVRAGGTAMVNLQVTEQSKRDLLVLESIVVPLSFLVLIWVFGGVFAAALPIVVGVMAILGSLAVLRAVTFFTDVSIFALNLTTAMGLALAIDYTLLMISRYRDELAGGADRAQAVTTTMVTAGRTVLFSAVTVALSMAVMVLFPMNFLRSFAYAGVATVAFAALSAVVVTPAAIMLLGDRLDALDVRRAFRRILGRPEPATTAGRSAVLVPLNEIRDAPGHPDRGGGGGAAGVPRRTVLRRAARIPRRPGAAEVGVGPSGRRPAAQPTSPSTPTRRCRSSSPTPTAWTARRSTATPPICPGSPTWTRCRRPPAPSSTASWSVRRWPPPARRPAAPC